jgi:NADH-quinone oxidoreductase subunit M
MSFAMAGTFLAQMVYCIYFLGTFPIYFIALIWGNGDAERKSSDQILFIHIAGSLFMLIAFVYLYQKQVLS